MTTTETLDDFETIEENQSSREEKLFHGVDEKQNECDNINLEK